MRLQRQFRERVQLTGLGGGTAKGSFFLTRGIPTTHYLEGLMLRVLGRMSIVGAVAASIPAEAPSNFLERVIVRGNLRGLGEQVLWNISGASLHRYVQFFRGTRPEVSSTPALATAVADYDFAVSYYLPFVLLGVNGRDQMRTLLPAPLYNSLELEVQVGNGFTLAAGGAGTRTLAGFGGGGNPTLDIHTRIPILGSELARKLRPAIVKRTFLDEAALVQTTGTDVRIRRLNIGNTIARLLLKTGVVPAAGATSENPAFSTLSDAIITRARIKRNSVPIRDFNWPDHAEQVRLEKSLETRPVGYNLIDFCESGFLGDALNTFTYGLEGTELTLDGDVNGAANQRVEILSEEVIPLPRG